MLLIGDWAPGEKQVTFSRDAELVLGNLEGPVLAPGHGLAAAPKAGPSLSSDRLPADGGRFVFSLANNHLMDYGAAGLEATLGALARAGVRACGAGATVAEARRPLLVEERGVRVAILAACEAQFGVARHGQAGVAELGPWLHDAIGAARREADAAVVTVHAAAEESPWPSPYLQELYRSLVDAGAAVVHGHHSHVPQGWERYRGGVILYGLGNCAVDPGEWSHDPNGTWSLAADVDLGASPVRCEVSTLEVRDGPGARSVTVSAGAPRAERDRYLEACNAPLADPGRLAAVWQEVALRLYHHHAAGYMRFAGPRDRSRWARAREGLTMMKRALRDRPRVTRDDHLLWYHMIACESHRQMLATALGVLGGEIADLRSDETRRLADRMMPWSVGADGR